MINIDFDAAKIISDYIIDETETVDTILSNSSKVISSIKNLPLRFFN